MIRFGLRLLIGGGLAAILGLIWLVNGLQGDKPDSPFAGGTWKGPVLSLAGAAAVIMGIRMLREGDGPQQVEDEAAWRDAGGPGFRGRAGRPG